MCCPAVVRSANIRLARLESPCDNLFLYRLKTGRARRQGFRQTATGIGHVSRRTGLRPVDVGLQWEPERVALAWPVPPVEAAMPKV
jgi:hypothetical protein